MVHPILARLYKVTSVALTLASTAGRWRDESVGRRGCTGPDRQSHKNGLGGQLRKPSPGAGSGCGQDQAALGRAACAEFVSGYFSSGVLERQPAAG